MNMKQFSYFHSTHRAIESSQGFTLVELLIVILLSGLIGGAIYSAHTVQQRVYLAQEEVVEMQQNIRAGLGVITRELRTAGYDPTGAGVGAGIGIQVINPGHLNFTRDLDGDGAIAGLNETVDFGFVNGDVDGNLPAGTINSLGIRSGGGAFQAIADNIEAIEFRYLDAAGNVTAALGNIETIEVSVLARAAQPDPNFNHNQIYVTPGGQNWGGVDNFRRRFVTTRIKCRNLGL